MNCSTIDKLDLKTYNKYGKEIAAGWVQMIRDKSVYNKLDLDAYNKYNIENDAAIEIMGKDNGHHHVNKKCWYDDWFWYSDLEESLMTDTRTNSKLTSTWLHGPG